MTDSVAHNKHNNPIFSDDNREVIKIEMPKTIKAIEKYLDGEMPGINASSTSGNKVDYGCRQSSGAFTICVGGSADRARDFIIRSVGSEFNGNPDRNKSDTAFCEDHGFTHKCTEKKLDDNFELRIGRTHKGDSLNISMDFVQKYEPDHMTLLGRLQDSSFTTRSLLGLEERIPGWVGLYSWYTKSDKMTLSDNDVAEIVTCILEARKNGCNINETIEAANNALEKTLDATLLPVQHI